jgi:hypothetical protein
MLLGVNQWSWIPLPGAAGATTGLENKTQLVSIREAFAGSMHLQCVAFTEWQS